MNQEEKTGLLRSTAKKGEKWEMFLTPWLFFVISLMVSSTSIAGEIAQCTADALPIQITDETKSGPTTILSATKISDYHPDVHAFMTAVTQHVAARLDREKLCIDSANSKEKSLLQFVNWPLTISEDQPLVPAPSLGHQPDGDCRISSPWIDLAFERRPVPWIRAVVRWSQRQWLVDQALLEGARNVPEGLAMPLKISEFMLFASDYSSTEIRPKLHYSDSEIFHKQAAKPIEERVPPDLLWLLRYSWQAKHPSFGETARGFMNTLMGVGAESYTQLVIALIDRCFISDKVNINYGNILGVADLISLEHYKIYTPQHYKINTPN